MKPIGLLVAGVVLVLVGLISCSGPSRQVLGPRRTSPASPASSASSASPGTPRIAPTPT